MPDTREIQQVLAEAEDIAAAVGHPLTTAHILLALFATPCAAGRYLRERGVGDREITAVLDRAPAEPAGLVQAAIERAREIAAGVGAPTDSIHLLIAFCRERGLLAHTLLQRTGLPLAALRNTLLSWYTGGRRPRGMAPAGGAAPTPVLARVASKETAGSTRQLAGPSPGARGSVPKPARTAGRPGAAAGPAGSSAGGGARLRGERRLPAAMPPPPAARRGAPADPEARPSIPSAGGGAPDRAGARDPAAIPSSRGGAPSARRRKARQSDFPAPAGAPVAPGEMPAFARARPAPSAPPGPPAEAEAQPLPPAALELDPGVFPQLHALGRNLTRLAAAGRLDPVVGREAEIEAIVDILGKRRGNNPVLVGEPGVGKTAVVEGVAQRLLETTRPDEAPRIVVELEIGAIVAGTSLRGALSERLNAIKEEVRAADGRVIVFLDELHTIVGAGATGDGPQDAANELKTALARGEFPCIGATTFDEFRKHVAADPALERRFTPVVVEEPGVEDAIRILRGIAPRYAAHHRVAYTDEAIEAAAALAARHIPDRQLPDKAIGLLDLAGSRAARAGESEVDARAIAEVVARVAGVPRERLLLDDRTRLLLLEKELGARVIGHDGTIARIAATIRRNYAGFASRRPMGSFLFLGPTGVGKTELARALAEALHGTADALLRLDMSELGEAHAVARLIGAPPGYVGHGDGGQLTEAVRRRPACVVLLDEIEKAHRDVQLLLLQILDEGRLTDARGRRVDFSQAVVVLTSNLGAEAFGARSAPRLGFGAAASESAERSERALEIARASLPPELWNRIDERCLFEPLGREAIASIARLQLADTARRLAAERRIELRFDDAIVAHLLERGGWDPALGARPMRQAIQREVEAPLAEAILRGAIADGASCIARIEDGAVVFQVA